MYYPERKSLGNHPQTDMKELQAGIQLVKTKYIQLYRHSASKKKIKALEHPTRAVEIPAIIQSRLTLKESRSQPVATTQQQISDPKKPGLPFPVRLPLERLRRRTLKGVKRLEHQAKRINQLSAELEAAVLELKAIASEINPDWKASQATQNLSNPANVCKYHTTTVPHVEPKPDGSFVLISKPVDLFQAEREATLLAQTLRHRAKRKRKQQSRLKNKG